MLDEIKFPHAINISYLLSLSPLYQLKVSGHQVYNDTARISNNNGEVDRTLPALTTASNAASTAASIAT